MANALLEQAGDGVLPITNQGLADVLRIGDQHRPSCCFAIQRPASLERGDEGQLDARARRLPLRLMATPQLEHAAAGLRSCAIALMCGSRNPAHDGLARAALELGFEP